MWSFCELTVNWFCALISDKGRMKKKTQQTNSCLQKGKCYLISEFIKPLRIAVLNVAAVWLVGCEHEPPPLPCVRSEESSKISACLLISEAGNNPDISIKSVAFSPHCSSMRVILQADLLCCIISLVWVTVRYRSQRRHLYQLQAKSSVQTMRGSVCVCVHAQRGTEVCFHR